MMSTIQSGSDIIASDRRWASQRLVRDMLDGLPPPMSSPTAAGHTAMAQSVAIGARDEAPSLASGLHHVPALFVSNELGRIDDDDDEGEEEEKENELARTESDARRLRLIQQTRVRSKSLPTSFNIQPLLLSSIAEDKVAEQSTADANDAQHELQCRRLLQAIKSPVRKPRSRSLHMPCSPIRTPLRLVQSPVSPTIPETEVVDFAPTTPTIFVPTTPPRAPPKAASTTSVATAAAPSAPIVTDV